ncbi:ketol-acid reductoisomerase [Candidatus Bathyarchaeota archaeon RBG_13_38_9]|nr:MAG: ketol-acid reductoisomerase [Candidatus Bathyarchaeota archaeon RBG_13_38_9]
MAKFYHDQDADMKYLQGKTIAVIGYGNQGHAQALTFRDSGVNVVVGLKPGGKSWKLAEQEGFKPLPVDEAAKQSDIIHMLFPDLEQPGVYKKLIEPNLNDSKTISCSHGYNIHFKQIIPPKNVDVIMVAPKSPGARLREIYKEGFGVPALVAVYQDASGNAKQTILAMAKALGHTKAGVIETTFKEEAETDIIGEQTVLGGGSMELVKKGFEVLVEAGYQPELAYFEVASELKLMVDLLYEGGLTRMMKMISHTAQYGSMTVGPRVIDDHVKENMRKVVKFVQSGEFAKEWSGDPKRSMERLGKLMDELQEHPVEKVGKKIRKMAGIEKGATAY